ncbi:MAG: RNA polymerase sigma-54 factor [Omnitrophica bacterium GWA2_41_15]|nr:MAG: RNA polymerase sigma-54 factor [Omnitrophica bacterium GWA2_41_15]
MPLQVRLTPKLTYKLRLTPQMRLDISLLQMPLVKLKDYIKQQIEENPLLETESMDALLKEDVSDLNDNSHKSDAEKQDYRESLITYTVNLQQHLLRQLHLLADTEEEHKIGQFIIDNINDDGYLRASIEEIAESAQAVPLQVQKVLSLIQTFDPVGVCARDIRECLLLQIKTKGQENSLAGQVIDKYLHYLEKKRFEFIAKKLKVPIERIQEAVKEIANLEPKPGRSFNTERAVRWIPDAILKRNNDKYEVMLNDWELPSLKINPKYKRMLNQKDITEDTKEYLKERLEKGKFLINAINKRKDTIQKVTEAIVYIQEDFLDNGMQNLKSMTLSQIAKLVGKHKSTVSRTVSNKYLQTPDGIFELRHFLNSGVKQENGELYSSKAIKSKIKELINHENKETPLTDQKIVNLLKQDEISISRRAIAKYRHQLKILPSQSRRE